MVSDLVDCDYKSLETVCTDRLALLVSTYVVCERLSVMQ